METSKTGIDLIKKYEGLKLKPYLCPAGIPTVGYGTTVYPNGRKVKLTDKAITKEQAESYLRFDVQNKCENYINVLVKQPINQNQFDALVSFVYNLGASAFERSTLLKKINQNPNDLSIEAEFLKWINARVNGKLTPLNGLEKRRSEEAILYFSPVTE